MTNPGKISRTYYTTEGESAMAPFGSTTGLHFSEIGEGAVGLFVPLVGIRTDLELTPVSATESIGLLPYLTWTSLEKARYRDLFQGSVMHHPRAYYIRRFAEPGSDDAATALAEALVDTRTPEHADAVQRLQSLAVALLIGEGGALISPMRVPWTITSGYMRRRLRSNRARFYSWVMQDDRSPLVERLEAATRVEFNEVPTMIFSAEPLALDASLVEHATALMTMIDAKAIFGRVPELHDLVRRLIRICDPSNSRTTRLVETITVFEQVFGRLSPPHQQDTLARLSTLMQQAGAEPPTGTALRSFRNAVAHGRVHDVSIQMVFGDVILALRIFLDRALNAVANHPVELPAPRSAFDATKKIVFAS